MKKHELYTLLAVIAILIVLIILLWDSSFKEIDTSMQVTDAQIQAQINRESRK